jgi:5-methyltetrahydrofolate--homocysteine methyltransferase
MEPLLRRLERGDVLVSDGAWGTLLQAHGLRAGECPEAMNLSRPELLAEIAGEYVSAGAEIIHTNTFGASPARLSDFGLAHQVEAINRQAVIAVRSVTAGKAYLSGSVGPSGKLMKPYGGADPGDLSQGFEEQIRALVAAGVDLLTVETMMDLREAELAVRAARKVAPGIPVIATMTFDPTPRGFYTVMGVSVPAAVNGLHEAGADVVGSNCGNGLETMIEIAREFRAATDLPVMIQSNAGVPIPERGRLHYPETPEFFAEKTQELLALGVAIIGGCCGTTPEYIRAIRRVVDQGRAA